MTKFPSEKELKKIRDELSTGEASKLLPKDATVVDRVKFNICALFVAYKREHSITQVKLAEQIGIDEALMSKILHYNIDEFTIDRLIRFLAKIYPDVELKVDVA